MLTCLAASFHRVSKTLGTPSITLPIFSFQQLKSLFLGAPPRVSSPLSPRRRRHIKSRFFSFTTMIFATGVRTRGGKSVRFDAMNRYRWRRVPARAVYRPPGEFPLIIIASYGSRTVCSHKYPRPSMTLFAGPFGSFLNNDRFTAVIMKFRNYR